MPRRRVPSTPSRQLSPTTTRGRAISARITEASRPSPRFERPLRERDAMSSIPSTTSARLTPVKAAADALTVPQATLRGSLSRKPGQILTGPGARPSGSDRLIGGPGNDFAFSSTTATTAAPTKTWWPRPPTTSSSPVPRALSPPGRHL